MLVMLVRHEILEKQREGAGIGRLLSARQGLQKQDISCSDSLLQYTQSSKTLPSYVTEEDLDLAKGIDIGENATMNVCLLFHFFFITSYKILPAAELSASLGDQRMLQYVGF